jgi:hypothetical protein
VVLAVIVVGVSGAVVVTAHGPARDGVPKGFELVHARGPVEHAQIEWYPTGSYAQRVIDLRTGAQRRAPVVFDVWWDRGRNLFRAVAWVDGRIQSDTSGRPCQTATGFGRRCLPPKPFDLRREGYTWPVDPTVARVTGRGDFRGHDVIWVQRLARAVGGMREPPVASMRARIGLSGLASSPTARSSTRRSTGSSAPFRPRRCRSSCPMTGCPART